MTIEEALDYVNDINATVTWTEDQKVDEAFFNNVAEWLEELKELRKQSRWIPVEERLPEYNECVYEEYNGEFVPSELILMIKKAVLPTIGYYIDDRGFCADYNSKEYGFTDDVIAWMPLPDPFKKGEQNDK